MKTFWGWRDQQLPDGTLIFTSPAGQTYVTTPGSALLFPSLCAPTGDLPAPAAPRPEPCGERTAMMPQRRRTRTQDRAARIAGERKHNRDARLARRALPATCSWPTVYGPDDDPPPF
ncbi:13e12 repeat-containing protein [Mycobacterium sp. MOTT36Y]|nr:13e12 repeat-containing protein [Mycobacterium sp. MOTT36Y]